MMVERSKKRQDLTEKEDAMAFRINHLHLKTPNPKKTADFYVEYTGAKVVKENIRPDGSENFRLDLHGVELNITQFLEEQKLGQFYGLEHDAHRDQRAAANLDRLYVQTILDEEAGVLSDPDRQVRGRCRRAVVNAAEFLCGDGRILDPYDE